MSTDWKKILATVAPGIATMLGGPLAGTAVGALAQGLLGKPTATEAELAAAIGGASPDTLIKLKQIDADLRTKFLDAGIKMEDLGVQDRASARQREVQLHDPTTRWLAFIFIFVYFLALWAVWKFPVPTGMENTLNFLLGTLTGALSAIISYYFGSSAGSDRKNAILDKALNQ